MKIEQTIINAVEISKRSKIPVLLLSNPGLGKTTILKRYAKEHKLHLETLIGSRFTPEEISGYQCNNGGDHLVHMNPEWFDRIKRKNAEGIKSLLFIDELSTCSEYVQGALLSLIFDRCIGNGKMLPDDCLIIAAANYSGNLPSSMEIMAPTLNRFILINLNENYDAFEMLDEFIEKPNSVFYPSIIKKMDENSVEQVRELFHNTWREIFIKYSDSKSSLGLLDIANQELNEIYSDNNGPVYNFISGRTMSYLFNAILAYMELGLNDQNFLHKMADGLVGAGTCLFTSEQAKHYREYIYERIDDIVLHHDYFNTKNLQLVHDINRDIAVFMTNKDRTNYSLMAESQQLQEIVTEISNHYSISNFLNLYKTRNSIPKFVSEMESIFELIHYLKQKKNASKNLEILTRISMDYYALYCDVIGTRVDYLKKYGRSNKNINKICFVKANIKCKQRVFKTALTYPQQATCFPKFYVLGEESSILSVTIHSPIIPEVESVLVYKNNIFQFVPTKEAIKSQLISA